MQKLILRIAFIALFPLLILQYAYCLRYTEAFPAFIMPSFSGSDAATSGRAYTELIELQAYAENEAVGEMTYNDLLYDVRHAFRRNVMLHSFSPPPRSYIRPQYQEGLNHWVKERCRTFLGHEDLTRLEVRYVRATWDLNQRPPSIVHRETNATHVIPFK